MQQGASCEALFRHCSPLSGTALIIELLVVYIIMRGAGEGRVVSFGKSNGLSFDSYVAFENAINPLFGPGLSLRAALSITRCHPVLKCGNPIGVDVFAEMIMKLYRRYVLFGHPLPLVLAAVLFVIIPRSKLIAEWLLGKSAAFILDGPKEVAKLCTRKWRH